MSSGNDSHLWHTHNVRLQSDDYLLAYIWRDRRGALHVRVGLNIGDREAAGFLRDAADALDGRLLGSPWYIHET